MEQYQNANIEVTFRTHTWTIPICAHIEYNLETAQSWEEEASFSVGLMELQHIGHSGDDREKGKLFDMVLETLISSGTNAVEVI